MDADYQSVTIAGRRMQCSAHVEYLAAALVEQASDVLAHYAAVFPKGNTWVGRVYRVPSLLLRVDCTVQGGVLWAYEVEDRPDGVGTTAYINPSFQQRLAAIRIGWPQFRWVSYPQRATDDGEWLGNGLTLEEALRRPNELLLVRSRPEDEQYHTLEARAVAPVRYEGCKRYGEKLGLWEVLTSQQINDAWQPSRSVVVKPIQGTRGRSIGVYLTEEDAVRYGVPRKQRKSIGDIRRRVRDEREVVCQSFIPPMRIAAAPHLFGIYRLFFGFDTCGRRYLPLGGAWMAAPHVIVHGMESAVVGPLVCV